MERREYEFTYNGNLVYKGFFKPYEESKGNGCSDVQTFAQGIVTGLRFKGIKYPCVRVIELRPDDEFFKRVPVLLQR